VYDKTVRRRRAVLGLLVALSLILLTAYFGESVGGGLHSVQRGFLAAVSPIQDGANRALKPVRDLFGWVGDTLDAKSERDKLRKEVQALQAQNVQDVAAARQGQQYAALLGLDKQLKLNDYRPVTGHVLGRSPTLWYATITVDRGSSDGVHRNDPVVNGDGLVGKITTVTSNSAIVTLITDHTSGVSATDNSSGTTGIVQPAVGDPNDLLMQFVRHVDKVQPNDVIVTSGTLSNKLDSLFPPNIPIGRVTRIDAGDLFQGVHVTPLVNLRQLDVVQILTRGTQGARPQAVAAR
jgi:rod shape-determining protein MreC